MPALPNKEKEKKEMGAIIKSSDFARRRHGLLSLQEKASGLEGIQTSLLSIHEVASAVTESEVA